ncbi:uncharacterized protein LOC8025508 isoform X2 [Ixodes scapularis]|nr:uncharacterized protein LOC8025508 isoform X2 [Ixodes scapularis]
MQRFQVDELPGVLQTDTSADRIVYHSNPQPTIQMDQERAHDGRASAENKQDTGKSLPAVLDTSSHEHVGILNPTPGDGVINDPSVMVVDRQSFCGKVWKVILIIRLEIFLMLYLVSRFMTSTPIQDLLIQKACRNTLHLNASICDHIDDYSLEKDNTEKVASVFSMYRVVVALAPSAVIAIFIGPWCDKYGYKVPLLVANVGYMISACMTLGTIYRMELPLYANVIASIPDGLCGGLISVFTAIYSQATVTTANKDRRIRFFALSLSLTMSSPLAGNLGGQLYAKYGWKMVMYVSLGIAVVAQLWAILAIGHLVRPEHAEDGFRKRVRNLFQLDNLSDGLKACLKPRPNKGKSQLWCLFGALCCTVFDIATMSIGYFFVRKMYSWSVDYYAKINSLTAVVSGVLNMPIIFLFTRVLKLTDPAMAVVGSCFQVAQMVILGLAFKEWLYYLQAMVAVPAFLAQVGIRTHLSKLLDQDEVGKVFSFLATCDAVLPIAGELMYTAIFNWSISFLPGMPYLFTACITLISVGLLSYCTKVTRDNIAYEEMSKADESVVSVGSTAVNS